MLVKKRRNISPLVLAAEKASAGMFFLIMRVSIAGMSVPVMLSLFVVAAAELAVRV